MMVRKKRIAQIALEYAMLITLIVIALLTMTRYMQRSISAKVEHVRQDLNSSVK